MFYFYTLRSSKDGELYFGYTSDLKRRQAEHANGEVLSTRARRPLRLVYYEAYRDERDARNRERQIKLRAKAHSGLKQRIKFSLLADFK